jgi:hypothetical protein
LLETGRHYSQCALLCLVVPPMDQRLRSAFTLRVWILNESHQLLGLFELYQGLRMAHSPWLISSELGLLPSLSLVCCRPLPVCCRSLWSWLIFALLVFQRCPGYEGSLNEARHGSQADPVWSSAPRPLPPTFPPPRRPPRPPPWRSRLKLQPTSRPSPRLLPTDWRGWIAQGPHWITTQDLPEILPLLHTQVHWLLLTLWPPCRFRPRLSTLDFRLMVRKPAKIRVSNPTLEPALALIQNVNGNQASHCCRAWYSTCVGTWMTSVPPGDLGWTRPLNSCIFFQQCRVLFTPQQRQPKQQELRHQYWHQLPHWRLRTMPSQTKRRMCLHPSRRTPCKRRTCQHSRRTPCNWTGHQSRRSRLLSGTRQSTPSSWTRGRITTPISDMPRCLCYFAMCGMATFSANVYVGHTYHT